MRSFYSLSFSLIVTLLHGACCILPLLSLASLSILTSGMLAGYQPLLTAMQWILFGWLTARLVAFYVWKKYFHGRTEMLSFLIGWLIALSGLLINWWEPFKSEEQTLAEQQFERFKSQRELRVQLSATYNMKNLIADLREIEGVRQKSINPEAGVVTLSYHKGRVSEEEIFKILKLKGYIR